MTNPPALRQALTRELDPAAAVADLQSQLQVGPEDHVLFFVSPDHDREALGAALVGAFGDRAHGCTTAGEIGPEGYTNRSLVAVAFDASVVRVHAYRADSVRGVSVPEVARWREDFDASRAFPYRGLEGAFGILLVDGLCECEEALVAQVHPHFPEIRIVGGSAGDELAFESTPLFTGGSWFEGGAVLLVVETDGLRVEGFRIQDFEPVGEEMVITGGDPASRLITELDGLDALEAFAETVGVEVDALPGFSTASHAFMVRIDGQDYIRSVREFCEEGIKLYAAIDEGVIVRVCRSKDTVAGLEEFLGEDGRVAGADAPPQALVFDCILRRLQYLDQGSLDRAGAALRRVQAVGFSTYGEVTDSIHVNQTMTGLLIWGAGEAA